MECSLLRGLHEISQAEKSKIIQTNPDFHPNAWTYFISNPSCWSIRLIKRFVRHYLSLAGQLGSPDSSVHSILSKPQPWVSLSPSLYLLHFYSFPSDPQKNKRRRAFFPEMPQRSKRSAPLLHCVWAERERERDEREDAERRCLARPSFQLAPSLARYTECARAATAVSYICLHVHNSPCWRWVVCLCDFNKM